MKNQLTRLAILIALTFFAFPLQAQDQLSPTNQPSPTNLALAEQLVGLMHLDKAMNVGLNSMSQAQSKYLDASSTNISPATKAIIQKQIDSSMKRVASFINPEKVHAIYVSAYATIFTAEELQGAIDFYQSPIGQQWIQKQPLVSGIVMARTMETMPKMSQLMGALDALKKSTNGITPAFTNFPAPPTVPAPAPTSLPRN
jgi:hypothetical protein